MVSIPALVRIVLTEGANSYTYTKSRILSIDHYESPFSQRAEVLLNNADGTLSDINFRGYKGVLSYGATTTAGDEYSACAPLYVVPQQFDSAPNRLVVALSLKGIPDLLDGDHANGMYIPGLTDTVKDIINGILAATIDEFDHCTAYTVTWDSEDALIDSFLPKQAFRVFTNRSRLSAVRELLSYTKCMMLVKADGNVHIAVPRISGDTWVANTAYVVNDYAQPSTPNNNFTYQCTTAGTSHATTEPTWPTTAGGTVTDGTVVWTARAFDYEYSLAAGYHPFLSKQFRQRLVLPNYVTVNSLIGDVPQYTGYATDPSYTLIRQDAFENARLASNAQATNIAKAMIAQYQLAAESGSALVPNNTGAEVLDYAKITDSRQSDTRLGNLGYVHRKINLRQNKWQMSFGFGGWLEKQAVARSLATSALGQALGEGAVTNIALTLVTDIGATLLHSNDTAASSTSQSYTKVREILIPCWGYLRVKFDLQGQEAPTVVAYGKLYKNGTAIGTERSNDLNSYVTYSEDISGFKPGDLLQLYVYSSTGSAIWYRNFRLYWDETGQVAPYKPAFVNSL